MARGRFLSASISMNERLSSLPNDRHRCAWLYALPHADRDGLLPGDPHELGCLCYSSLLTKYAWTQADIPFAIEALTEAGLWRIGVDAEGRRVIEILRFGPHQEGMRYDRERKSLFQVPIKWDTPATAGGLRKPPAELQVQVQVELQEKESVPHIHIDTGNSNARAHVASSVPEKALPLLEISGSRRQEIHMLIDEIVADFKAAHPLGDKAIIRKWDREALYPVAHVVAELPDRRGFFRRAIASLPPHRLTLEACLEKLNDPTIVNGSLVSTARIDDGQRLMAERAAHLGITPAELVERYERGEYTMPQRHKENATRVIPVLPEEESVDSARLVGMERIRSIITRAIPTPAEDLA